MTTPPGEHGAPGADATHAVLREQLGAHVLGQLDERERAELDAHLRACATCRAELAELAPLAGPLTRVDPAGLDPARSTPTVEPSPDGFAAVLGRIRSPETADDTAGTNTPGTNTPGTNTPGMDAPGTRTPRGADAARRPPRSSSRSSPRSRRRLAPVLVAAAAAAVVGLAGVGVGLAVATGRDAPVAPVAVQALDPAIRASAGTIDHTWGVEMVLTASGFAEGQRYDVTVLDLVGRPVPAGAFRGTGPAEMECRLNSSVLREQASGFVVTDADGDEVLRSQFA